MTGAPERMAITANPLTRAGGTAEEINKNPLLQNLHSGHWEYRQSDSPFSKFHNPSSWSPFGNQDITRLGSYVFNHIINHGLSRGRYTIWIGLAYMGIPTWQYLPVAKNEQRWKGCLLPLQWPPHTCSRPSTITPFVNILPGNVRHVEEFSGHRGKVTVNAFGNFDYFL